MSKIEQILISLISGSIKNKLDSSEDYLEYVYLEVPKDKRFGDFSTNIAMRLSKVLKRPPAEIADELIADIKENLSGTENKSLIRDVKKEKPGFINFYITDNVVIESLSEIIREGKGFGGHVFGKGKKIQIEFVSANPTGPLTVAHGRQAAVGDSLANILKFCGYEVTREYYINDEGVQMNNLARSVKARYEGTPLPENGYKGEYIKDIAIEIKKAQATSYKPQDENFLDYAYNYMMKGIEKDLVDFGVEFDVWYSQKELSRSGKIAKALEILEKKGFLFKEEGALWFRSTAFGDDKDRVLIKSDGSFTYLAPDIAYHKDKFERGYDKVINIWGPDHHGYINRIKAACQALSFDKDRLSILIAQLVTLFRDKKPVRMSTREGEFITLREVIDEVGKDAGRFFFIMRKTDSHLDFDLELAKSKSMDNPVYYIQYAYARISSVLNFSSDKELDPTDLSGLGKPQEIDLIKKMMQYPRIIESSSRNLEPYILLSYLQELSSYFHSYYDSYRIVTDDKDVTNARMFLVTALKRIILSGLTLLGVSAPEKM
ncbi:MAG: arginine--tRNA ligase [Candidatus Omnitrophota bacterium]